jgi:hypothetical protein
MTKIIEGNLILDKDTVFDESLEVHGSILGKNGNRYNLTVNGNISALYITANYITAKNLDAMDITAKNLDARDITAWNITAWNIHAHNITAEWDITTVNIIAMDITASGDITALDITAKNITAINLDAVNITAKNITAINLDAVNITARNLDTDFIICEKLEQEPGSTLNAKKVINNRLSYKRSAIDNSQFIKQEKCDACGQVRRGKEQDKLSEKLK